MDCKEVAGVLFLFVDNEMGEDLEKPFQDHIAHCPGCARELDSSRKLVIAVRQRCLRQLAPMQLRIRILTSLPHRQGRS